MNPEGSKMTAPLEVRVILERLCAREDLTTEETYAFFLEIVRGRVSELALAAVLTALKAKGEVAAEIAGAAMALRASAVPFDTAPMQVADTCGTGGDGAATFNVSTAAAFVAAACGVPVVKHGNRSVSSRCGSADVLEALGISVELEASVLQKLLAQLGFCFLFAPRMHPGIRHAGPVRQALGVRTLFNVLGPLANPARPAFQVLGTGLRTWVKPMAETLHLLGTRSALIVHGSGLDEIALHGETHAIRLHEGTMTECVLMPEDVGLKRSPLAALRGGAPLENAQALRDLLGGAGPSAFHDAVALNAGALLWVTGTEDSLHLGVSRASEVLRSGAAGALLTRYQEACHDL
jgi:anthranilate phosphoribosyltransferase